MQSEHFTAPRLGILGGGQLGRMLLQDAINLDINISVLDPDPEAPCRHLADHFETGSFKDYDTVYRFGKTVDILTVEIEHVNVDALEALEKEGVIVRPSSRILRLVQDKGAQKIFYRTHGIPTAEFHLIEHHEELPGHAGLLPVMQKLRTGGYDGKGVTPLRTVTDFTNAFNAPSVLEKMVDFDKELAVIVEDLCIFEIFVLLALGDRVIVNIANSNDLAIVGCVLRIAGAFTSNTDTREADFFESRSTLFRSYTTCNPVPGTYRCGGLEETTTI